MNKLIHCRLVIATFLLATVFITATPRSPESPALEKSETRCGWFSNPTPANASLFDRDGEWIIAVQGGDEAEGDWPSFSPKQWVESNVHYGYGCACLRMRVDHRTHKVIQIESSKPRPLSV